MEQRVKKEPVAKEEVKKDLEQEAKAPDVKERVVDDLEQIKEEQQRDTEQKLDAQAAREAECSPYLAPGGAPEAVDETDLISKLRQFACDAEDLFGDLQRGTTAMAALVMCEAKLSGLGMQRLLWLMPMLALFAFSVLIVANVGIGYLIWMTTHSTGLALTVIVLLQTATCAVLLLKTRQTLRNISFPRTRAQMHRISSRVLA